MGDLTGKLMFVLTGEVGAINHYITNLSLDALAFSAARVNTINDVVNLPAIGVGLKNDIVFYNMQQFCNVPFNFGCGSDADFNTGLYTSNLNYINRTWGTDWGGQPGSYNNTEYAKAIDFSMNNIAVANITGNPFNPTNGKPENGIQYEPAVTSKYIANNRIYSNYQNVTQAATQTITATNLIVEQGTHYRMIAGNNIKLKAGVHIQSGSDTKIRIDDCRGSNYTLRQVVGEQLTQTQIEALMHELNKELYGYQPKDEKEIVGLKVFPNPASSTINISYTNYLLKETIFTLYDLTGRIVKTTIYTPSVEGQQIFTIDINNLKGGTYFYILQVGEQNYNGKIVKMGF